MVAFSEETYRPYNESVCNEVKTGKVPLAGILLIATLCAAIVAVMAFLYGAGFWGLLLSYTLSGVSTVLILSSICFLRS